MTTTGDMTRDTPSVLVVLHLGPPLHYVARLGVTGWSDGWGWSETDAVDDLARVLIDDQTEQLPLSLHDDFAGVVAWLQTGYDLPILEP